MLLEQDGPLTVSNATPMTSRSKHKDQSKMGLVMFLSGNVFVGEHLHKVIHVKFQKCKCRSFMHKLDRLRILENCK